MSAKLLRELPRYRSHKVVQALKIERAIANPRGYELHFGNAWVPIEVPVEWVVKHSNGDADAMVGGYFVVYPTGYQSWSPADALECGYTPAHGAVRSMDFGDAIRSLKLGKRVARDGWNGKGMWLSLSAPASSGPFALACSIPAEAFWSENNRAYAEERGGFATVLPCITMKTATGEILMGWLASQTDMLADDWCVVE